MAETKSLDRFLDKAPVPGFDCLDLAREVWGYVSEEDAKSHLDELCAGVHAEDGHVVLSTMKKFEKLETPSEKCFVVMHGPKGKLHIGVFVDGRVIHMTHNGVEYRPLSMMKMLFHKIGYYR